MRIPQISLIYFLATSSAARNIAPRAENNKKIQIKEYPDNSVYKGNLINNEIRHGQGTMTYRYGSTFTGTYVNDRKNGFGTFTYSGKYQGKVYAGNWKNDNIDGQGKMVHRNGATYNGMWKNNKRHGKGINVWPNKASYKGEFYYDTIQGKGIKTWPNGVQYTGQFHKGKQNGSGKTTWPDGRQYVGNYKNGRQHGFGTFTNSKGAVFEGYWDMGNGGLHGYGIFSPANDPYRYEGMWENGQYKGNFNKVVGDFKENEQRFKRENGV